jgi:hypothetical protein
VINADKNTCICGSKEFINTIMYAGWTSIEIQDRGNVRNIFDVKSCTKCGTVKFIKRGE